MAVERLAIAGYKTHANTELQLGALTLLVGPNSVGKSSILEALEFMARLPSTSWRASTSRRSPVRAARGDHLRIDVAGVTVLDPARGASGWELRYEASRAGTTWTPKIRWNLDGVETTLAGRERAGFVRDGLPGIDRSRHFTASALRLEARALAKPCAISIGEQVPQMASNGHGLAAVIAYLSLFQRPVLESIEGALVEVVPSVRKLRIEEARWVEERVDDDGQLHKVAVRGAELRLDFVGASNVPAQEVSEGTLLALGVLVAAINARGSHLLMLDDVEHGLHPRAQRELVAALRGIWGRAPECQFLLTSHSPYVVDAFDASEVVVMNARADGSAVVRRLSEHPNAERAKGLFTTGEFLAAEQEDWVLDAEAVNG